MNIFFCADTHFGHEMAPAHSNRPWPSCEQMDEGLIAKWNDVVKAQDQVWLLGDFAWKSHAYYKNRLRGKITLIVGNHDRMPQDALRQFTRVIGTRRQPGILECCIDKQPLTLCHMPLSTWNSSCHGSWCLHGHSHGGTPEYDDYLRADVGVDVWAYAPVPWEVIKKKMEARIPAWRERRRQGRPREEIMAAVAELRAKNVALLACK